MEFPILIVSSTKIFFFRKPQNVLAISIKTDDCAVFALCLAHFALAFSILAQVRQHGPFANSSGVKWVSMLYSSPRATPQRIR